MLNLGNTTINKTYLGATEMNKVYLGSTVVFEHTVPVSLLIDDYPTPQFAYSLRTLKTGVTSVIQARKTAGGTSDFTADEITDGTMAAWAAGDSLYVSKYYDQSGNGKDISIASNVNQIVSSGTVLMDSGLPYVNYTGNAIANNYIMTGNSGLSGAGSVFATYSTSDAQPGMIMCSRGDIGFLGVMQNGGSTTLVERDAGTPDYYANGTSIARDRNVLYDNLAVGTDVLATVLDISFTSAEWIRPAPFVWTSATYSQATKFREIIVYNDDQTANKAGIEANIMAYYGI